ncbi:hypothetical protein [Actinomadura sp. HBU206391]|uniref:hypothetical protein n=1 Tax=Actinomadura sp. HBU206391 TaxID=2731692 RepID=UPI00164F7D77|nr:hypothetical protein [Actinomadura sp. HBU206391]MBC6459648.1 hypothetical protein [Actinomadura sp. HBU206391]
MELTTWVAAFAATGRIGPIHVAADAASVEAFGAPLDAGAMARGGGGSSRSWTLLYGDLEVVLCGCREVAMIRASTWRDIARLPHPGTGEPLHLPGRPAYDDVVAALDAIGCTWRFDPQDESEGHCAIRTEPACVDLAFTTDEGPRPLLREAIADGYAQERGCRCRPPSRIDRSATARRRTGRG